MTAEEKIKIDESRRIIPDIEPNEDNGEKMYSTCMSCGLRFEQLINPKTGGFTSFRTCPTCRNKLRERKAREKAEQSATLTIKLPYDYYPWQKEAHEAFKKHRFLLLACGVRCGKDAFSIAESWVYFTECLSENRHIHHPDMTPAVHWWIIAPTLDMARQNWNYLLTCIKTAFPFIKQFVVSCDNTKMVLRTVGNGLIEVKSAYNEESLVGVGLDIVTITEAARIRNLEDVWGNIEGRLSSPMRGLEADRKGSKAGYGKAIINSSPNAKPEGRYFARMFKWGIPTSDEYSSEWVSLQFPWTANPTNAEAAKRKVHTKYGEITYEESLIRQYGMRKYRQDYLGEFLEAQGAVYKGFRERCVVDVYSGKYSNLKDEEREKFIRDWKTPIPKRRYRASYDPATGSSSDSPVLVIRDMETNKIVYIKDMYGMNYEQQYDWIAEHCKRYNNAPCVFSKTGHTPIEGNLAKRGIAEIALNEQGGNKAKYVNYLALAVENGDIQVLNDGSAEAEQLINQMEDYTEDNGKYSNNEEAHDDWVSALYMNYYDYGENIQKKIFIPRFSFIQRQ